MAPQRGEQLSDGQVYHIYSRSIAKFEVFNTAGEYNRFTELLNVYRYENFRYKYSQFSILSNRLKTEIIDRLKIEDRKMVNILCYCLMPTHFHLVIEQISDSGISSYIRRLLNGYSKYFNVKHGRNGPLWSSRFKSVFVKNDEQLLHLTRYIHLNPTSAGLIKRPEEWQHSSYNEYLSGTSHICNYSDRIEINPKQYQKFVNDRQHYQRELSIIKAVSIDNYTG